MINRFSVGCFGYIRLLTHCCISHATLAVAITPGRIASGGASDKEKGKWFHWFYQN